CVSCKGCRRECPTGVDMARMKIEVLHQRQKRRGLALKDRVIAYLPRYAPHASRLRGLLHLRDRLPGAAALSERLLGFSAARSLPRWHARPYRPRRSAVPFGNDGRDVALLVDTFTTWFEPEIARAAEAVLAAAGYRVHAPAAGGARPLCCGRTFLATGLVEEARREAERTLAALRPLVERGLPVIGLEPSCLLTLRDEYLAMRPGPETEAVAARALLLEEFLWQEQAAGRLRLPLKAPGWRRALLHGHCHQKAFDAMAATEACLGLLPGLAVETVASSCCGMAGAFGYEARHYAVSQQMAELSLLPAVRAAAPDTVVVADGTSCRHQIQDGTGRRALHAAELLQAALA
ncbi:MAG: lactate dehydrogenase, partial [Geminicoccaceae bacterium]|nr:lactate dehydrogenase [Geminicoccaceae bacterium]